MKYAKTVDARDVIMTFILLGDNNFKCTVNAPLVSAMLALSKQRSAHVYRKTGACHVL